MPVQMIELEEVQMMDVSDDALEASVNEGSKVGTFGTGVCQYNAACTLYS